MRLRAFVTIACMLVATQPAAAADVPSLDLRGFRPALDPNGALYTEPTRTPGALNWNAALWLSYAYRLVTVTDAAGAQVAVPVRHQLSLDYGFGLGLGERFALGVLVPSVIYQNGNGHERIALPELPPAALGDLGLSLKAALMPPGELGGFGLAALGRLNLPTGNPRAYVSDGALSSELSLLSELQLLALSLRLSAGTRLRSAERSYLADRFGHDLLWGAGIALRPLLLGLDSRGRWQWVLEAHGAVSLTPRFASSAASPAVLGLSARYAIADSALIAGVELPLDSAIGVPIVRGVLGFNWAPRVHDADGDGVPDDQDQCPELAEDRDGFEDGDGCPDFDNDDDGVPDDSDRCPKEQEDNDGFQDDDGCPDPDNDADGIPDTRDACPDEPGISQPDPKLNGCKPRDSDGDGLFDHLDRCPAAAEDKDGFQDDDGCPDPDNDVDGVPDVEDACPDSAGPARSDPKLNGCPNPDRDGDGFDDEDDQCPDEPEPFDGVEDDDGCPENPPTPGATPLAVIQAGRGEADLVLRVPLALDWQHGSVAPAALPVLRAIAQLLNQAPERVLLVGVRPRERGAAGEQRASNLAFAIVNQLRHLTHRDEVAEVVGFDVVARRPGAAANGVGFRLLE